MMSRKRYADTRRDRVGSHRDERIVGVSARRDRPSSLAIRQVCSRAQVRFSHLHDAPTRRACEPSSIERDAIDRSCQFATSYWQEVPHLYDVLSLSSGARRSLSHALVLTHLRAPRELRGPFEWSACERAARPDTIRPGVPSALRVPFRAQCPGMPGDRRLLHARSRMRIAAVAVWLARDTVPRSRRSPCTRTSARRGRTHEAARWRDDGVWTWVGQERRRPMRAAQDARCRTRTTGPVAARQLRHG